MNDHIRLAPRQPSASDHAASTTPRAPQKGYWIAHINIADEHRYAIYGDVYEDVFTNYGARYVIRGGSQHVLEGTVKHRTVVVEFESLAVAMECYNSFEGQQAKALRTAFSEGDLVIVEGFEDV